MVTRRASSPRDGGALSGVALFACALGCVSGVSFGCGSGVVDGRRSTLIDDLEDGDIIIDARAGRTGEWFTLEDPSFVPPTPQPRIEPEDLVVPDSRPVSDFAAHMERQVGGWGGGFGVSLAERTYDARLYSGIAFWARRGEEGTGGIFVNFPNLDTHDVIGKCREVTPPKECNNHFRCQVSVPTEWTRFVVLFDEIEQPDWGESFFTVAAFKPLEMKDVTFTVGSTESAAGLRIDLWIDDLAFVRVGEEAEARSEVEGTRGCL